MPRTKAAKAAAPSALDRFITKMDKSYGDGVFAVAGDPQPYEVISTGSLTLDDALIVGGYVKGRIVELWGPEGAGKTTLGIFGCIEALKDEADKFVCWVDVEHRFDRKLAQNYGLDMSRVLLVQPNNAEEVADQVKDALREGIFSMIVVDSIGAMLPQKEADKDADEATVGLAAKTITRMVKIASVEAFKANCVVLLLNQVRANIGYGGDTTTPGGYLLKHATTMKLNIRRTSDGALKVGSGDKTQQVGHMCTVKVERNSVALAYRKAEFSLLYFPSEKYGPIGIDRATEAFDVGLARGFILQSGGWYTLTLTGERVQGKPAMVDLLRKSPAVLEDLRRRLIEAGVDQIVDDGGVNEEGEVEVDPELEKKLADMADSLPAGAE